MSKSLLKSAGFQNIEFIHDLQGIPRYRICPEELEFRTDDRIHEVLSVSPCSMLHQRARDLHSSPERNHSCRHPRVTQHSIPNRRWLLTISAVASRAPLKSCIEILYCGVCHSDLHMARNEWGNAIYPMVPGHEIVGSVTAAGKSVTKFKPGDIAAVGVSWIPAATANPAIVVKSISAPKAQPSPTPPKIASMVPSPWVDTRTTTSSMSASPTPSHPTSVRPRSRPCSVPASQHILRCVTGT